MWFFSLSAAETRWTPLLITLGRLVDGTQYTEDEIISMPWQTKCRLTRSDSVTCARYFQHRVDSFLGLVLKTNGSPLGKAIEFFYHVEFQQREAPGIFIDYCGLKMHLTLVKLKMKKWKTILPVI